MRAFRCRQCRKSVQTKTVARRFGQDLADKGYCSAFCYTLSQRHDIPEGKINPAMTPQHKASGEQLAKIISDVLPEGVGFALLIFDFGEPGPGQNLSYISNAKREDMIPTFKEFIARNEGRSHPAPGRKQ